MQILGIHLSYDGKGNNKIISFSQKIRKLQTKLDMWSSRDLTIFGRVMLLKVLGLSQLVYSVPDLVVPQGTADLVKTKLFRFLWRNKKKRRNTHDRDTNITMFKALKLSWIPTLIKSDNSNWCTIPNHFFKRMGGLNVLFK